MVRKVVIFILLMDVILVGYMLLAKNYFYSILLAVSAILILTIYGRLSAGGYIQNVLLIYMQKKGVVTKKELVGYLSTETQGRANVNVEKVVDDILAVLAKKQMISIEDDRISIR